VAKIYSPVGAKTKGGRWNSVGKGVIYASLSYACSMLEKIVHAESALPLSKYLIIEIPADIAVERIPDTDSRIAGWWDDDGANTDSRITRAFGDAWLDSNRTAVLIVPSATAMPIEKNVMINPNHPDFSKIQSKDEHNFEWDKRIEEIISKAVNYNM
jgi:RES domain-containing protein